MTAASAHAPAGTRIEGCSHQLYITPKWWRPGLQLPITVDPKCGENEFVVNLGYAGPKEKYATSWPDAPPDPVVARRELWFYSRPWYQRLWLRVCGCLRRKE